MEVTFRPSKTAVLLVTVSEPKPFYQILRATAGQLERRISTYLSNAKDVRGLGDLDHLNGKVYVLGYCEKPKFDEVKFLLRKRLGAEGTANFIGQVSAFDRDGCPVFEYQHKTGEGIRETDESAKNTTQLRELVAQLSDLDVYDRLR